MNKQLRKLKYKEEKMKKKVLIGIVIVLVVIGAIEIAVTMSNNTKPQEDKTQTAETSKEVYAFADGEKKANLGEEFNKEAFGQEENYSEIASCAFEGLDKTYTYANYEITTFPDGEKEKVYSVYFLNENIATQEGVKITDSVEKMKEVYGEEAEVQGNQYRYTKGKTNLEFIVEEDVITSIQYTYTAEN